MKMRTALSECAVAGVAVCAGAAAVSVIGGGAEEGPVATSLSPPQKSQAGRQRQLETAQGHRQNQTCRVN
jgi:hypothetical protein